jgi:hypothetical protein
MNVCGQQTKVICKYNNKKKSRDLLFDERKKKEERKKLCVCVYGVVVFIVGRFSFFFSFD